MEKYYIVSNDSDLGKAYLEYKNNLNLICNHFKKFANENNISTKEFMPYSNCLWIIPTKKDIDDFRNDFCKQYIGLFKKTSNLSKKWVKECTSLNIKSAIKPMVSLYLKKILNCKTRIFDVDDVIYCYIEFDCDYNDYEIETLDGITYLKTSDFFKTMEDKNLI